MPRYYERLGALRPWRINLMHKPLDSDVEEVVNIENPVTLTVTIGNVIRTFSTEDVSPVLVVTSAEDGEVTLTPVDRTFWDLEGEYDFVFKTLVGDFELTFPSTDRNRILFSVSA